MFLSWSATNFKSIGDRQTLQLAPLTVLAGANNSGKSSLLQSILILCQTLRNSRDEPPLVLDGDLFRRGEAQELIHFGRDNVSFAFEADLEGVTTRPQEPVAARVRMEVTFQLSGRAAAGKRFEVATSALTALDREGQAIDAIRVQRRRRAYPGRLGTAPPAWLGPDSLACRPVDDEQIEGEDRYSGVVGVSLAHFVPEWAIERRDARSERYQELLQYLVYRRPPTRQDPSLAGDALRLATDLLKEPKLDSLGRLTFSQRDRLRALLRTVVPREAMPLLEPLKGDYRWRRRPLSRSLEESTMALRRLAWSVRHLGPLRLPPQFVYTPVPYVQEDAVGSAGEFTVAELNRNRLREVDSVNPETGKREKLSLEAAVVGWLRRMGILEAIVTRHTPKIGHLLFVRPPQLAQYVDLTSVGVGASQVLPVLVQALITPPGSVLIFEQPELHLHPRVQAILADFFIGLAQTGRQCLVETHSEHVINRIRFRIAEADTPDFLSLVRIYFAEREAGETRFRPVTLNEYGAVEDWPKGFFDESLLESERILRSSLRKRSRRES